MKIVDQKDLPGVIHTRLKSLDSLRIFIFFLLGFLTLGIFWIFTYWFQDLYFLLYRNEEDVWKADYIFFKRQDNSRFLIKIERKKCKINPCKETTFYMFFQFLGQLYYFDVNLNKFIPIKNEILNLMQNNLFEKEIILKGLTKQTTTDLKKFYGQNKMEFQIRTFWQQLFFDTLDPFNTIQIIFGLLFMFFHRILYSLMILVFVFITIYQSTVEYIKKMNKLKNMTEINDMMIVKRRINNDEFLYEIETQKLVVGDLVELQKDQIFPCDLVIVKGSCLVNEALLTGESIPILKSAYEFNQKKIGSKYQLMSGTKLVHKKSEHVYAVVVGTGWNTAKGILIGSVVFQQKAEDKFRQDFMKVLFLFNSINIFIMLLFIIQNYKKSYFGFYWVAPYILDIAKNCFHPTLFFIMAYCIQVASDKLRKKQIYSLKTNKIVEGGAVKQICFDKTGTLTKLDINIYGFILNSGNEFDALGKDIYQFQHNQNFENFVQGLLTCHQLEQIEDQNVGDPLEEILLEHLDAKLQVIDHPYNEEVKTNSIILTKFLNKCLKIDKNNRFVQLHTLEFTSVRKRMSVVSLNQQKQEIRVFCKGAPEIIQKLCKIESLPDNYDTILKDFSEQGYRILSMATKKIDDYQFNMSDEQNQNLEQNLEFLGFLLFENPLKETTQQTIIELEENQYELAMITGDNIYTAINVGYSSGIIQKSKSVYQGILKNGKLQWTFQDQELHYNFENTLSQTISLNQSKQTSVLKTKTDSDESLMNIIKGCILEDNCLALTGDAFQKIFEDYSKNEKLLNDILQLTKIYARASAPQKELIIKKYKKFYNEFDRYVAFVGDGSNDSLALKTANVGLSIGNNDSSFSAAFFTSDEQISNIKHVIIEGKACLGSAIQNFTYLVVILLTNTFIYYLYSINNWNAVNFDYIAGVLFSMPQAIAMQYSKTHNKLTPLSPPRTLYTYNYLKRIILQIITLTLVYLISFLYINFSEITKNYKDITQQADSQYMQHSDYFFVESKYIFALYPFAILSQSWIAYQGLPFKKSYGQNLHLVLLFILDIIAFMFFIFPDLFFDDYPNIMYYIKYYTRFPEFDDMQRLKFIMLYTIMILIQAFTVQIYIDLDLKAQVETIQRNPDKFKEKQNEVLVKLDQLNQILNLIIYQNEI